MQNKHIALNRIIGAKIFLIRKEKGINQDDLSKAIGCTRPNLSNIESGAHGASLDIILKLAKIFGVPVTALLPAPKEYDPHIIDLKTPKRQRLERKIALLQKQLEQN